VPAVYIHSLLGSRNWNDGVKLTGRARTINREKLDMKTLVAEIENPETFRYRVFTLYKRMIQVRREQPAFHPKAGFEVLTVSSKVFAIIRFNGGRKVVAATNIASNHVTIELSGEVAGPANDLLTGRQFASGRVTLAPYEVIWLMPA
jgi:sucrose phosphorylase